MQPGRGPLVTAGEAQALGISARAMAAARAAHDTRDTDVGQLSRGTPPRVAGRDDASLLALGSLLASPSSSLAVACEGRSPMTVAGPRRICTGFLRRHRLTGDIVACRSQLGDGGALFRWQPRCWVLRRWRTIGSAPAPGGPALEPRPARRPDDEA